MSKKKDKKPNEEVRDEKDYYKLNTDAVDRLVNANSGNVPKVSDEEIRKYTGKRRFNIPTIVKVLFTKFWFKGAACFFFFWGLGTYLDSIDLFFVFAVAIGMMTDLLENNLLRFFEKEAGEFDKYIMFPKKGMLSFFLNIPYAFIVLLAVRTIYNLINIAAMTVTGNTEEIFLGVEPLLFGLFYLLADMVLILMRNTFKSIIKDAVDKQKTGAKK
jgi:hypothetical protein